MKGKWEKPVSVGKGSKHPGAFPVIKEPSALEKIADTPAAVALTAVAAYSGGWLAALLPVLSNTLAQGRARERVTAALRDLNDRLEGMAEQVQRLSDAQYTAMGRVLSTLLETTDEEKLRLLKAAVSTSTLSEGETRLF